MHGVRVDSVIDHKDGDYTNNSLENLRCATQRQNSQNNSGWKKKHLRVGVHLNKSGKYVAYIRANGKQSHLGTFKSQAEAIAARKAAEEIYFGEFSASASRGIA
jgi:hypothetical protein